jgi:hypothetical protein
MTPAERLTVFPIESLMVTMKTLHSIAQLTKRLGRILGKPDQYFSQEPVLFADGLTTIILLFLVTFLQKLVWADTTTGNSSIVSALGLSALNTLMAWTGFFAIYYLFATIFKKKVLLADLLAASGSAGLPLVLTTLLSCVSWWIGPHFGIADIIGTWTLSQTILGWIGLALSWPGLMGFFILRSKLRLPGIWPLLLTLLMLAVFIGGWLVTII